MKKEDELIIAVREGKLSKVKELLNPKIFGLIKPVDVNYRDKDTMTPLIHAAIKGHKEVAEYLIQHSADIHMTNKDGFTALMGASKYGFPEIALMLITKGADVNAQKNGEDAGWTALMFAAWQGKLEVAKILVQHGADINANAVNGGWTALLRAIKEGHDDLARFLISEGADVNKSDKDNFSPLICASRLGRLVIARLMIEKGADVNAAKNGKDEGWSSIMFAAWQGKTDIIKLLLEYGVDPNSRTSEQWTPLMWAAREGHLDTVTLLIEHGALINARSDKGYQPLELAAVNGYLDIIKKLVEAGADINARDDAGETALTKAESKKFYDIAKYLRAQRAKEPSEPQYAKTHLGFPAYPNACLSIVLRDASTMENAGPGEAAFNNAIQCLNNRNDKQAEVYFKQALSQGLDTLRQGYAHANLGALYIRNHNLKSTIREFIAVLNYREALYESIHDAVQYLIIIYDALNENVLIPPLETLKKKTMLKLNYSLSPEAVAATRALAEEKELDALEREFLLIGSGTESVPDTSSGENIKTQTKQEGESALPESPDPQGSTSAPDTHDT